MRAIAAGLCVFASILGLSNHVFACDCEPPSLEVALRQADAIFEGQVQSLSEAGATFRITQQWKGVGDIEELDIDTGPGTCALSFEEGTIYLIFARLRDGRMQTDVCDRSQLIENAEADLTVLGPGIVPVDPGSDPDPAPEPEAAPAEKCSASPGSSSGPPAFVLALGLLGFMRRRRCP